MVNFHDPTVLTRESSACSRQPFLSKSEGNWTHLPDEIDKFRSFVSGIFIWEFLITLDYEWSVIRGIAHTGGRYGHLATVALNMVSINVTTRITCQLTETIRIAIWDRKKIIVALATGVWGVNIAFLIQVPILVGRNQRLRCLLSTIVAFAADTILLLIMLFGLHRLRRHGGTLMGLGRLLWNQVGDFPNYHTLNSSGYFLRKGVAWFLLAVATELTPTVLIILNLNRNVFHHRRLYVMLTELDYAQNCRGIELGPLGDYNVNCCHTDVSLSVRLFIL
ncbi:hypothetical protein BGY98DRAFT_936079 [Russula aff. rugulosa BPL654]|nr:hypothetical protein BGY98DRAFT_936079 [Russula aff. rugulosa BPL654]